MNDSNQILPQRILYLVFFSFVFHAKRLLSVELLFMIARALHFHGDFPRRSYLSLSLSRSKFSLSLSLLRWFFPVLFVLINGELRGESPMDFPPAYCGATSCCMGAIDATTIVGSFWRDDGGVLPTERKRFCGLVITIASGRKSARNVTKNDETISG